MSAFMANYWPAGVIALAGLVMLGLSWRATRTEGVRLAVIMFSVGVLGMAVAVAYERYLTHVIRFAGPPAAVPGRTALAVAILVAVAVMCVPAVASLICLVKRRWTGSLAFISSAAFMSCVSTELSSLGDNDPMWRGLLVAGIVSSVVAALLAYAMSVRYKH